MPGFLKRLVEALFGGPSTPPLPRIWAAKDCDHLWVRVNLGQPGWYHCPKCRGSKFEPVG